MKKVIFFLIFCLIILSCNENILDDIKNKEQQNLDDSEILIFETYEKYIEACQKTCSFSFDELKKYEESLGYCSFGRKCEEIYYSVNPDDFSSINEVKAFVNANNEYLQLVEGDDRELTLETVVYNNPEKYIINAEKMFQIGDTIYKSLTKQLISTSKGNIDLLRSIDDHNISSFRSDVRINFLRKEASLSETNTKLYCGKVAQNSGIHEKEKITMQIRCYVYEQNSIYHYIKIVTETYIRPYHKSAGVWFYCTRTITARVEYKYNITDIYETWLSNTIGKNWYSVSTSKIEYKQLYTKPIYYHPIDDPGYSFNFYGFDCWAYTPGTVTTPALLQCNTQVLD